MSDNHPAFTMSAGVRLAACRVAAKILGDVAHKIHPQYEGRYDEAVGCDAYGRVWVSVEIPIPGAMLADALPSVPGATKERRLKELRGHDRRSRRGGSRSGNDARSGADQRQLERRENPPPTDRDFSDWITAQIDHPDPADKWWGPHDTHAEPSE